MFRDLSSLAIGQLLSMLLGFLGFAYLARTLPTETYGLVEYAVGLVGVAAIVIEGGMGTVGTLGISRDPGRAAELAALVPGARLLLALLAIPLVGLSGHLTSLDSQVTALIWLFGVSLLALPFKQDWLLQGLERMTLVAPAQAIKSAAFAVGVFVAVKSGSDLLRIALVEITAAFLGAAYYVSAQRSLSIPLRLDPALSRAWPLIRTGSAVGANNIVWALMLYIPISLVANVAGATEAAWLGGVQRIVAALVAFSALYFFNLYPLMARVLAADRGRWERLIGSSFRVIAWASLGSAMIGTLLADSIVVAAFGEPFLSAAPVFGIYIWLLPLRLLSGHARWTLLAGERQTALLAIEAGGALALFVSGLALVPLYGAAGAAMSVVVANIIAWSAAQLAATRLVAPVPGMRDALPPIGATAVSLLVAWYASDNALVSLGVATAIFLVGMKLTAGDIFADAIRVAHAKQARPDAGAIPERSGGSGEQPELR